MTPLTFESLITYHPFLYSHILAGWKGRASSCLKVNLNDEPAEPFTLLLIHYHEEQLTFLNDCLNNEHTSGIILFSNSKIGIPANITKLADEKEKPLLFLTVAEGDILYDKIGQTIQLFSLGLQSLLSNDLSTYWLELFHQESMLSVLNRLSVFLGEDVYFFSNENKFIPISKFDSPIESFQELKSKMPFPHELTNQLSTGVYRDEKYYLYTYKDTKEKVLGYLLFKKTKYLSNAQLSMLQTLRATIITWQSQLFFTKEIHSQYKDQFMLDILNNNIETEYELKELAKRWEISFTSNPFVLVIDLSSKQSLSRNTQVSIRKQLLNLNTLPMSIHTTSIHYRIVAIVIPNSDKSVSKEDIVHWAKNVKKELLNKFPMIKTRIGIGRPQYSSIEIYKSFQEAKIALQMHDSVTATGVIHYEDIGYVRLLTYIHDDLLDDFSDQYLSKLENYDLENETEYMDTLDKYCLYDGSIIDVADALFIHQNTLRKRMKKIESILNIQLSQYKDLVNIIIALKITKSRDI